MNLQDTDWKKVGTVATATILIGTYPVTEAVRAGYRAMRAYNAAAQQTQSAPQINFPVPEDGSVDFDEQVRAEVGDGFWARNAYRSVVEGEMMGSLGPGWNHDVGENVLWRPKKERVWDPYTQKHQDVSGRISMKGGMPNGRTVPVRDYNRDGRFGNVGKRQMRELSRSEFKTVMSQHNGR
jgi:hypothetical protein